MPVRRSTSIDNPPISHQPNPYPISSKISPRVQKDTRLQDAAYHSHQTISLERPRPTHPLLSAASASSYTIPPPSSPTFTTAATLLPAKHQVSPNALSHPLITVCSAKPCTNALITKPLRIFSTSASSALSSQFPLKPFYRARMKRREKRRCDP